MMDRTEFDRVLREADEFLARLQSARASSTIEEKAIPADPRRRELAAALRPNATFRTPLLEQLNDHAIQIALDHGITVHRGEWAGGGWGSAERRELSAPPVTNEENYAIFLHEVGHVVDPDADARQYTHRIKGRMMIAAGAEIHAWRWAMNHALTWTLEMHRTLHESLRFYRDHATEDERGGMAHVLWLSWFRVLQTRGPNWTAAELEQRQAELTNADR